MQDRPTALELLRAVTQALQEDVLPATTGAVQHQVRVAANLCQIVARELELGPASEDTTRQALARLLDRDPAANDTHALCAELATRLRSADAAFAARSWSVLVDVVRAKLAIAKPGYDRDDGSGA